MGITLKYGENPTAAAGVNTFCWFKAGSTLKINFQGILIILKKLPNVVNLAPIQGAREFPEKIKTKNYKAQAGAGNKQQAGTRRKQALIFFPGGTRPQVFSGPRAKAQGTRGGTRPQVFSWVRRYVTLTNVSLTLDHDSAIGVHGSRFTSLRISEPV